MKVRATVWTSMFIVIFITGGLGFMETTPSKTWAVFYSGGMIATQIVLLYVLFSSLSLLVLISLTAHDNQSLLKRLSVIVNSTAWANSAIVLIFLSIIFIDVIWPHTFNSTAYFRGIALCGKSIAPVLVFFTLYKNYPMTLYKSSVIGSANIVIIFLLTHIAQVA